jgi:hypothetical protein
LPGRSLLTREQKREFTLGWLSWLGAESVGVLVAMLNLIWVPFVAMLGVGIPDKILTIPIFVTFGVAVAHFFWLYRLRVRISHGQMLGAVFAAMGLQWTVARAVGFGLIKDGLPFVRTAKGGPARRSADFPAFWEALIGGLLVASAVYLHATNWDLVREIDLFALALGIQSLPFLAAVALAVLEGSRLNNFAFWQGLEARLGQMLTRRPAETTISAPPVTVVSADKQVEPVQ